MSVIKHEAFLSAEEGTEVDALVRAEMVEDGAREDGLDGLVGALLVVAVVVSGAGDGVSGGDDVELTLGVLEAEEAAGDGGDHVLFVVDAREVGHLWICVQPETF